VVLGPNGLETRAGAPLLYAPIGAPIAEPPASLWASAERSEFQQNAYLEAATTLSGLARSADPAIRAGALVRLARNLRKANRPTEALDTYTALADFETATVGGEPAALVGLQASIRSAIPSSSRSRPDAIRSAACSSRSRTC